MLTISKVREMALALPETTEQDHHGMESFRVRGKIFATVPDDHHLRIMLGDEDAIREAVAENPGFCQPFYWGRRLACVLVDLGAADAGVVEELLGDAWLGKAPKSVSRDPRPGTS